MRATDSVLAAVEMMAEANDGSVLIVGDDRVLEGIFTERDLLIRVVYAQIDPARTQLADVMTRDVVVLSRSDTLDHAISVMAKHHVRHLPVEDDQHNVVGVISLRHLLHDKIDQVIQELKVLEDFDDQVPGG